MNYFNENRIARIAMKIADDKTVDPKLLKLMTKRAVMNYFYRLVGDMPGMHGYVNDNGWGHVHVVFEKIRETGVDLEVDTDRSRGGDYFYNDDYTLSSLSPDKKDRALSRGGALIGGKQWNLKIEFDGMRHWEIEGYLKAVFREPGFLDSSYDMIFLLF